MVLLTLYSPPFFLVVTKPPYEITETGWGEFEIIIKIFFIDPNERPVRVWSPLILFILYVYVFNLPGVCVPGDSVPFVEAVPVRLQRDA